MKRMIVVAFLAALAAMILVGCAGGWIVEDDYEPDPTIFAKLGFRAYLSEDVMRDLVKQPDGNFYASLAEKIEPTVSIPSIFKGVWVRKDGGEEEYFQITEFPMFLEQGQYLFTADYIAPDNQVQNPEAVLIIK